MENGPINIVWLKRDLRSQDHLPLFTAEQYGLLYLVIYTLEPFIIQHADTSLRHLQFINHSLRELKENKSIPVHLLYGEVTDIFAKLIDQFKIQHVLSYQESGINITWDRDKAIKGILDKNNIHWTEFQRDGIIRGIKHRKGWDKQWYQTMHEPTLKNTYSDHLQIKWQHNFHLPLDLADRLQSYPKRYQPPGEKYAWKYLKTFVQERGFHYYKNISKPLESRISCSRISPYLAWGNFSIKQAYQFVKNHPNYNRHKRAFSGMVTRLKWHCHFIQKFEVECQYENQCINRGYETLDHNNDPKKLIARQQGRTGFPFN